MKTCRSQSRPLLVMRASSPRPNSGIALVITMVMVTTIAFLAFTFLILTQRERGSVTTAAAQTDARLAAETALDRATAEILAPVLAYNDASRMDLLVSTNYINPAGFNTAVGGIGDPLNVSYTYANGTPLSGSDAEHNIANLQYNPRPPVFIVTNKQTGDADFRFYLDLNRNSRFETNGLLPEIADNGSFTGATNIYVGDPEWIGILERPEFPHSASNKFIARYAYIVLPESKTLDVNHIHNQAKGPIYTANPNVDGFWRNQGVGSWELNLAAFLVDLNTNCWLLPPLASTPYAYTITRFPSSGSAFQDALDIIRYRYGGNYLNLTDPRPLVDNPGIDEYVNGDSSGNLMTNTTWANDVNDTPSSFGYPGANNTNRYFTPQDLFDANKTSPQFVGRLMSAGAGVSSYDRDTFYRLLAQMGTDSSGADNLLNVNYVNVDANGNVVPNMETNYIPWPPLQFFTNAASRLLNTLSNGLSFNYIPIYPTNYYTPAVHRLLQVAANIYDATQTNGVGTNQFPTVFRPLFGVAKDPTGTNTVVFISGYTNVEGAAAGSEPWFEPCYDAGQLVSLGAVTNVARNVYSVPWILGAKKGFPNFNEFTTETVARITRKLGFVANTDGDITETNQMLILSVSNVFGVEAWNSYSNNYPRPLSLYVTNDVTSLIVMSNVATQVIISSNNIVTHGTNANPVTPWQGINFTPAGVNQRKYSFKIPLHTNLALLPPGAFSGTDFVSVNDPAGWTVNSFPAPQWWLYITNRLRFFLVDEGTTPNRVVDYVSFNDVVQSVDLTAALMGNKGPDGEASLASTFWITNRAGGGAINVPPDGVINQIRQSKWETGYQDGSVWAGYGGEGGDSIPARQDAIDRFLVNLGLSPIYYPNKTYPRLSRFDAPFQPTRAIYLKTSLQANDPLVHYTATDLTDLTPGGQNNTVNPLAPPTKPVPPITDTLGQINRRYEPWPNPNYMEISSSSSATKTDLSVKDPQVSRSDDWQFPNHPLPNIGWLGRVHRGTPWQTIYLKSETADDNTWRNWTGNTINPPQFTNPTNDWRLLGLFTATPNANAARGRLSVNQANLAAWSAVLSGVVVLSNSVPDNDWDVNPFPQYEPVVIDPAGGAGSSSPLGRLVNAINSRRTANYSGSFKSLGDILSVPELTVNSPFLNTTNPVQRQLGISEAAYERIPQQILGLLRLDSEPRFVVYAYGQSLKPAQRSIVQPSGLCTNYQITGEVSVRALVRIQGVPNKTTSVIESYNYLPPD